MITDLSIENYRGVAGATINGLRQFSILTGTNNSAKTTVLEAIAWLVGLSAQPYGEQELVAAIVGHRSVEGDVRDSLMRVPAQPSVLKAGGNGRDMKVVIKQHSGGLHAGAVPGNGVGITNAPRHTTYFRSPSLCFVAAPTASDPLALEEFVSGAERLGYREQILDVARKIDPTIRDLRILVNKQRPILHAESVGPDSSSRPSVWPIAVGGTGFKRFLGLAAQIAGATGTVLLDDPDAFLHPGLFRHVATMLWELVDAGAQVVMATHSPDLIEALARDINGDPRSGQFGVYGLERTPGGNLACTLRIKGAQAQLVSRRDDIRQLLGL